MIRSLPVDEFLAISAGLAIIDVRSPGEFRRGHIPGAVNIPLFDDAERAVVGTLYKQTGRDAAVLEGLRIVGPKLASIVERATELAPDRRIAVHCWRGGERSGSVAWLLNKAGFTEVLLLERGYKAFRAHVLSGLQFNFRLKVLGGYTGSGKTEILTQLAALGEQIVDLEALADHKGSSFGALGQGPQPTTEQFENLLWNALRTKDAARPIWVEDESVMIGRVSIPPAFFANMRTSRLYFLEIPLHERAARLVHDYGRFPVDQLAEAIQRISKRIGPQHCKAALEALAAGDMLQVALITLRYYDKTYVHGSSQRDPQRVIHLPATANDLAALAERLISTE